TVLSAGIAVIGIGAVIVRLIDSDVLSRGKRSCCSRTAGKFPFRFRGETVSVRVAVPDNAALIPASAYHISRGQPFGGASGVAVGHGIVPTDVFHREIVALELAGIISHELPVFLLGNFVD